jgi:hypothetical protein
MSSNGGSEIVIPGYPLEYFGLSSMLAIISYIYLKKKKFRLKR